MKKTSKRLNLNRETLRGLDDNHLQEVNGGVTNASCEYSCDPVSVRVCATSRYTC
ncbi:MAG: class I lanthipeptide [Thermoanaerobaculia bacterium]